VTSAIGNPPEFGGKLAQSLPREKINAFLGQPGAIARMLAQHLWIHKRSDPNLG